MTTGQVNPVIENNFSRHDMDDDQVWSSNEIREAAKRLAYLIDLRVPDSREKSLAMTNLEQTVFWSTAGIARNDN
jgi:hypothetical protein